MIDRSLIKIKSQIFHEGNSFIARVAELADALDLGSSAARRGGSSPPPRTP